MTFPIDVQFQMFSISKDKELRREATCVDVGSQISTGVYKVVVRFCSSTNKAAFDHPKVKFQPPSNKKFRMVGTSSIKIGSYVQMRKEYNQEKTSRFENVKTVKQANNGLLPTTTTCKTSVIRDIYA